VQLQLTPVFPDQLSKGIRVAGLRPGDQIRIDENPPIRVARAVSPCGYWYRRRASRKPGTALPSFPAAEHLPLRQTA